MASILGALAITYLVTRIGNKFFKAKYKPREAIFLSFLSATSLTMTISSCNKSFIYDSVLIGILESFIIYMPCLVLWLLRDLKKEKNRLYEQQCPKCGERGIYKDYMLNGTEVEWCPHCEQRIDTLDFRG